VLPKNVLNFPSFRACVTNNILTCWPTVACVDLQRYVTYTGWRCRYLFLIWMVLL
jgi:hypothetical protein